uniref:LysR family transcriptional regulator n=1 Tax=Intrasporangium sp. TaxID=1925024 RepID=UPI003221EDC7
MERRHVEYFLAVVEHGSFTAAAAALYLAQPSLSQAIRELERELGAPLFVRLHRGVRLTAAGTALVLPARQVMRTLSTARAAVQDVVGVRAGKLDLAMLPALIGDPLAPVISAFRTAAPGVTLTIAQPEEIEV